ncbi:hypothetical protein CAGGBEG34_250014 [Candidatus Glomeribacter gigasporarum BEG34]|uniref:Uncharacterized protein n=1 Tax=Candidatus Glomeribacter gigasporarum BEG34 TaxID=1070319 RepID=G2J9R5_9BURK|nr:hypothetical protein [Candidatus Glomeribacter gigasporarum]CCD29512.1 hypothetical protein CAGGBEG34_250014 [Candidatus Glomeribacter gigasporarum BEG34]
MSAFPFGSVQAQSAQTTPKEIIQQFCDSASAAYEKHRSPALLTLDRQAEALNQAYTKQHPGEKPPFGDGVPLSSSRGDAANCRIKRIRRVAQGVEAELEYSLPGEKNVEEAQK